MIAALLGILLPHGVRSATTSCAPIEPDQAVTRDVDTISVTTSGGTSAVQAGINMWNNCQEAANEEMPVVMLGGSGDIAVQVVQGGQHPRSDGGCGRSEVTPSTSGGVGSARIFLFATDGAGRACDFQSETMAHELGHVLGLDDSNCPGRIMGPPVEGIPRTVTSEDCQRASTRWMTPAEIEAAAIGGGGPGGGPPNPCGAIMQPPTGAGGKP